MISKIELEELLICPVTSRKLQWLSTEQVTELNERIQQGSLKQTNGDVFRTPLTQAFKIQDKDGYYPFEQGIIYLLPDSLISGEQIFFDSASPIHKTSKKQVKNFYDDFGWHQEDGIYHDARDSEDLRSVSEEYILQCHMRLNEHLPAKGKYLLDIASGPIQYPAYLSYSQNFEYRICADISLRALKEAQKKLDDKGIYLLCDITRLPIQANCIDALVSLHTLYHVPQKEQAVAFSELNRVLKPGGVSVVVYSWGSRSLLMNICMLPQKAFSYIKRKWAKANQSAGLYFYAHSYQWYCREIKAKYSTKLYSWRSVNVPFLKAYIHQALAGKAILKLIFWLESHFSHLMGRIGAYPLFVSVKK